MIYSRWRPDRGGYDYFESSERYGLGDDLPTPRLRPGKIGVASTSAGRPIPSGARYVGSGALARGVIAPMETAGLSMAGISVQMGGLTLAVGAALVGYWLGKRRK